MLWLLLLQVLASCLWLGHSEVVTSFESCPQFFYEETTPNDALKPNNPARICQRYNNKYHFATLYDRDSRIPIYSAYIYQPGNSSKPQAWLIEPQLIGSTYSGDMEKEKDFVKKYPQLIEELEQSQAVLEDYKKMAKYTRGHLNPSSHHNTYGTKLPTFTLTNIVPQNPKFNNGPWNEYEGQMMKDESEGCTTTYVITGAVPGKPHTPGERVNIPSHIWSAACCPAESKAWGVIAENNSESQVTILTLKEVEDTLTNLYGKGKVSLFHSACPRQ
ncbi:endonuclease domain-containing 1 protein-like [Malurus melanocephalus]|uniref:endonuclease domain-containing 1 protein-like n=1 Tax=Malurus melanocephalus TaxID=175006 RepID=UPI002548A8FB|nr:endonuclease domain-containing 1 protein-like [Malurus melanocephalus]